jgi:hypothetical protein
MEERREGVEVKGGCKRGGGEEEQEKKKCLSSCCDETSDRERTTLSGARALGAGANPQGASWSDTFHPAQPPHRRRYLDRYADNHRLHPPMYHVVIAIFVSCALERVPPRFPRYEEQAGAGAAIWLQDSLPRFHTSPP